jgi:5-methylthioadenosine/S-adenosylhomocysteine deaminase
VLIKNDSSPVLLPLLNPYGHVAFQAQRGDVHTVIVDGRVVKHEHRLVGVDLAAVRRTVDATVEHLKRSLGEEAWAKGMNPDLPDNDEVLDNPYQYTEYKSDSTRGARGSVFGEPGAGR